MPTTPTVRRLALFPAAATALLIGGAMAAAPAQAWDFPAEDIAEHALAQPEGHGGQCKVFAQKVVNDILEREGIKARVGGYGTPGGAYYGAYKRAGGMLVGAEAGQPGDVIQVIPARDKNKDFPATRDKNNESILHTAIIVDTIKPGVYQVRDSNYVAYETIGTHRWNPIAWRKRGVEVYVWRFGQAPDPVVIPSGFVAVGAKPSARTLKA